MIVALSVVLVGLSASVDGARHLPHGFPGRKLNGLGDLGDSIGNNFDIPGFHFSQKCFAKLYQGKVQCEGDPAIFGTQNYTYEQPHYVCDPPDSQNCTTTYTTETITYNDVTPTLTYVFSPELGEYGCAPIYPLLANSTTAQQIEGVAAPLFMRGEQLLGLEYKFNLYSSLEACQAGLDLALELVAASNCSTVTIDASPFDYLRAVCLPIAPDIGPPPLNLDSAQVGLTFSFAKSKLPIITELVTHLLVDRAVEVADRLIRNSPTIDPSYCAGVPANETCLKFVDNYNVLSDGIIPLFALGYQSLALSDILPIALRVPTPTDAALFSVGAAASLASYAAQHPDRLLITIGYTVGALQNPAGLLQSAFSLAYQYAAQAEQFANATYAQWGSIKIGSGILQKEISLAALQPEYVGAFVQGAILEASYVTTESVPARCAFAAFNSFEECDAGTLAQAASYVRIPTIDFSLPDLSGCLRAVIMNSGNGTSPIQPDTTSKIMFGDSLLSNTIYLAARAQLDGVGNLLNYVGVGGSNFETCIHNAANFFGRAISENDYLRFTVSPQCTQFRDFASSLLGTSYDANGVYAKIVCPENGEFPGPSTGSDDLSPSPPPISSGPPPPPPVVQTVTLELGFQISSGLNDSVVTTAETRHALEDQLTSALLKSLGAAMNHTNVRYTIHWTFYFANGTRVPDSRRRMLADSGIRAVAEVTLVSTTSSANSDLTAASLANSIAQSVNQTQAAVQTNIAAAVSAVTNQNVTVVAQTPTVTIVSAPPPPASPPAPPKSSSASTPTLAASLLLPLVLLLAASFDVLGLGPVASLF